MWLAPIFLRRKRRFLLHSDLREQSRRKMNSRRDFLKNVGLGMVGAGLVRPALSWAAEANSQAVPGKEGMILRSFRFLDLEAPPEFLNTWLTPVPHFFVRNHMFEPSALDAGAWRLSVGGEVEKPMSLSLAELSKIESHSVTNTLECAGNGRAFHKPQLPGVQWEKGAVGNAHERSALEQASWISGAGSRAGLDRRGVVQMADGDQGAREGVRGQLHEAGISVAEPTGRAGR